MRGSDDEIEATALVMTLTLITFGCEDNTAEEIFLKYFSHTHRIMLNPSAKPNARSKCAIFLRYYSLFLFFSFKNNLTVLFIALVVSLPTQELKKAVKSMRIF